MPEEPMGTQIDNLVAMRDIDTLYELMTEDEDWLTQFDAADGLIKLGDRRGFEFVATAMLSDDDEILEVAKEIQDSSAYIQMQRELEAERDKEHRAHIETARQRLQKGGKVYRYKMVYLAAGALISDDPQSKGFEIPALDDLGLAGWEIVHILPTRKTMPVTHAEEQMTGAYFLLKKEILPAESTDLDKK
jgi:hypothetical protein